MTTPLLLAAFFSGAAVAQPPAFPLRASMIAVGVTDISRSIKFYGEILGLPLSGKPGEVTLFRAGELTIALNHPLGRAVAGAIVGAVEIIFAVESVMKAYNSLRDRGCKFVREPREVTPGVWAATFTDPDGHRLTILGPHE